MSERPIKIALINQPWNSFLPPVESGSIAIWNDRVATSLVAMHADEVAVLGGTKSGRAETHSSPRLQHIAIPVGPARARFTSRQVYESAEPRLLHRSAWPRWVSGICRELSRLQPDVVHVHNLAQLAQPIRRALPRVRIALHMHCEWLSQLEPRWSRELLRPVDVIYGCSSVVVDAARRVHSGFGDNLRVVPNGVDLAAFESRTDSGASIDSAQPPVFLFVGRISPEKGLHFLLEAFASVLRTRPDARLRIVGPHAVTSRELLVDLSDDPRVRALAPLCDIDYLAHLRALAAPMGQSIEFVGAMPQSRLPSIYAAATVVVQPSLYESFGMPILEAMASSRVVLATRAGGMADLVSDGVDGLLVESASAKQLASAMLRLIDDQALRERLARSGYQRVKHRYGWQAVATLAREGYCLT